MTGLHVATLLANVTTDDYNSTLVFEWDGLRLVLSVYPKGQGDGPGVVMDARARQDLRQLLDAIDEQER